MMSGYGMNPGMMGGYGMMPNMMGYGMGPQMMGNYGYGRGPSMKDGYGYGTEPQMMTPETEKQYEEYNEKTNQSLDETKKLRKELHSLKFEYQETLRSTPEPSEKLDKMRREMLDLHQKIYNKSLRIK